MGRMVKHFVVFYSPGTFLTEDTEKEIASWDVQEAMKMADHITERYGATPFGFQFISRARGDKDFEAKEFKRSFTYYLGGQIFTREEVEARNLPDEETLRWNMRVNKIDRIIQNDNSWRFTAALKPTDVVLDYTPPSKRKPVTEKRSRAKAV